ncbi:MAG: lysogenization regulator HflD [Succinivibrionaceae bacterium]|nr:lysogenization regulator HflD [Succinivibrionaceae bacterium]
MADIRSETIALAALFQCCQQINHLAHTGYIDPPAAAAVIKALIVTEPRSIDDIYPLDALKVGMGQLDKSLGPRASDKTAEVVEITRMALKLVALELSIERNPKVFESMGSQIDRTRQAILLSNPDYESASATSVLASDAIRHYSEVYTSLISPNFPRLMIYGSEECLSNPANQEMIRALLLSAIRAVVLWRQVGGRRRWLIFRRRAIIEWARAHS